MAQKKLLDYDGLLYIWQKMKTLFAKQSDVDSLTTRVGDAETDIETLDGRIDSIVAEGGEPNVIDTVKVNGTALPVTDKAVNVDLSNYATKATTLSGYGITDAYTKTEVDDKIDDLDTGVTSVNGQTGAVTIANATTAADGLMSSGDKDKLDKVASGAEVNQNAFTIVKVGTVPILADAKEDTLTLKAGSNVTLTPDAANDAVTIAATDTTYEVATKTADGLMSKDDKDKLDGIAAGATANTGTITSVKTTAGAHTAINVSSGAASFNVPTNTSHLTNDSGFITITDVPENTSDLTNDGEGATYSGGQKAPFITALTTPTKIWSMTCSTAAATASKTLEFAAGEGSKSWPGAGTTGTVIAVSFTKGNTAANPKLSILGTEIPMKGYIEDSVSTLSTTADANRIGVGETVLLYCDGTNWIHGATGAQIGKLTASKANLASPTFTGTPKAPTAAAGTNTTQVATTEFVTSAVAAAQTGAAMFQGTVSTGTEISSLTNYKKGYYWVVAATGTYVGETCEPGDMIFCVSDYGSAYKASDFSVVQNNLDIAAITNAEIDTIVAS